MSKVSDILKNPGLLVPALGRRGFLHSMDDESYVKRCFKAYLGYELNLNEPTTFNEKIQWLKLNDRNPLYTRLVDKCEVKEWVAARIGAECIVPTLGVWDDFDEIDFDSLPERFVLKCTHDSGGLAICRDRVSFDFAAARRKIKRSLSSNYYWSGREWPYKNVKPRVIAEEYLDPGARDAEVHQDSQGMTDYKFYCFNGKPAFLYVSHGLENHSTARISFLSLDWELMHFKREDYRSYSSLPAKPDCFSEMIDVAKRLSAGIPFVRVDLYDVCGKVMFSEMTFSPNSGYMPLDPPEADASLGALLVLPEARGDEGSIIPQIVVSETRNDR